MDEIDNIYVPHLRAQFERGRPILFTGAGFSMSAKNVSGATLPSAPAFKKILWPICFPNSEFDPDVSLQDLYDFSIRRAKGRLSELLLRTFTVAEDEFPEWYSRVFSLPWQRAYTLNIDDLEQVVSRTATLPRPIRSNSVLKADNGKLHPLSVLEVMHLNGSLDEAPDGVTFSSSQYAQRLASPDPIYRRLSAELLSSPFVFIGSVLEEQTLWQSIEARRLKGGRDQRELRPRSYLVTPTLSPAKQALLGDFNVVWLQMTAEQFSDQVLSKIGDTAKDGLALLFASASDSSKPKTIPDVSTLAVNPAEQSEYLLGYQPIWADIQSGRAIERANDEEIWKLAESHWKRDGQRGLIVISGISGSGKSTALMRVALRFSAAGVPVSWVDPEVELSPKDVRTHARLQQKPYVMAVEDADLYGSQLSSLIRELVIDDPPALVIVAIRSGRVDRFINPTILGGVHLSEVTVPLLTDDDIDKLIDVLIRENRPGLLRGMSRDKQRELFREQSGRELLVAMIQATSGKKFSEKAITEMTELPPESARIYGLVAVATSFRFGLTSQDILIALGDETNLSLNSLEMMIRRSLLRRVSDGSIFLRHRVIAEVIRDALQINGSLGGIIQGLALVAASQSSQDQRQSSKPRRILRAILNHDFLQRNVGIETTRNLYASLEEILHWDYHYWLQRGSFEVELGDLSLAENFLNQARGLSQDDPYVETEWAYLLFSQANTNPASDGAERLVADASTILEFQMSRVDRRDAYPFHVMGSQGLAWSRRGIVSKSGKERYLRQLLSHLRDGLEKFKGDKNLVRLEEDIKREYLGLAVEDQRPLFPRP
jgi:SIR2-like domain